MMALRLAIVIAANKNHLKLVFSPGIGVEPSSQVLDIPEVCLRVDTRPRLDLERKTSFSDCF